MVDPVLESSLETETENIIKSTHFDNYHPKKGSRKNVFKNLNIPYKNRLEKNVITCQT